MNQLFGLKKVFCFIPNMPYSYHPVLLFIAKTVDLRFTGITFFLGVLKTTPRHRIYNTTYR